MTILIIIPCYKRDSVGIREKPFYSLVRRILQPLKSMTILIIIPCYKRDSVGIREKPLDRIILSPVRGACRSRNPQHKPRITCWLAATLSFVDVITQGFRRLACFILLADSLGNWYEVMLHTADF
ncbi:hypothetical protein RRG08_015524 [Elysia crispata]|uniref:Uncharacterized protein n=1 Tax=Elysia crispata TaxID=231223 RepID=A0AAE0YJW6_9GAST|nr:hypothetical protein RRG08_015524 [Elysia crispata]